MKINQGNPAALTAEAKSDIENALVASTPGGIEQQERRGQELLVKSDLMPIEMEPSQADFERLCFVFGAVEDELFVRANFPVGWTRLADTHSLYSEIVDERGRPRVSIFYKAAFYDRRAHAWLLNRFSIKQEKISDERFVFSVLDCGRAIFRTDPFGQRGSYDKDGHKAAKATAAAWLTERYPQHEDPTAYWDEAGQDGGRDG